MSEKLRIVEIEEVVRESDKHTTLRFKDPMEAEPGQFVMVWLPGVDEVPMSLSYLGDMKGITVNRVGEATEGLAGLKKGERMGIRGPFGKGYSLDSGDNMLIVAGGCGAASLLPAAEKGAELGKKVMSALGAQTAEELFFLKRAGDVGAEVHVSTDDGSRGYKGFVTELARELMKRGEVDMILTCGPELMMKKVVEMAGECGIKVQASLERYMKCGIGICDSCGLGGLHVCRDGPVFSGDVLMNLEDFGRRRKDEAGLNQPV